jgi:hypothetical protein
LRYTYPDRIAGWARWTVTLSFITRHGWRLWNATPSAPASLYSTASQPVRSNAPSQSTPGCARAPSSRSRVGKCATTPFEYRLGALSGALPKFNFAGSPEHRDAATATRGACADRAREAARRTPTTTQAPTTATTANGSQEAPRAPSPARGLRPTRVPTTRLNIMI